MTQDQTMLASHIQGRINKDLGKEFQKRLPNQSEACARKILEWLANDLQGSQKLSAQDVYHLAMAAESMLLVRDRYARANLHPETI